MHKTVNFAAKDRTEYIGASDISVIMGTNPWKTRHDLLHEKVTGESVDIGHLPHVRWGVIMEEVIAWDYKLRMGKMVIRPEVLPASVIEGKTCFNGELPAYCGASADGLVMRDGLTEASAKSLRDSTAYGLEIKTGGKRGWMDEDFPGLLKAPQYYVDQCQWSMLVTGLKRWDLYAYLERPSRYTVALDGIEKQLAKHGPVAGAAVLPFLVGPVHFIIEEDLDAQERMLLAAQKFWSEVEAGKAALKGE